MTLRGSAITLGAGESCLDGRTYRLVHEYSFGGIPLPEPGAEVVAAGGARIPVPEQILHTGMRFDVGMGGPMLVTRQAPVAAALDVPLSSSVHLVATDPAMTDRCTGAAQPRRGRAAPVGRGSLGRS